ncbi:MAG: L-seryl-tRNA(Sec) selenium transferase [Pseudomonadota bacterium]
MLRSLPQVDELLRRPEMAALLAEQPRLLVVAAVRAAVEAKRQAIMADSAQGDDILHDAVARVGRAALPRLRPVINATGVVIHTNLGRSILPDAAVAAVVAAASSYTNLEFDLDRGERGSRNSILEDLLCTITGAEAAMVVNNNAAAVVLVLAALAAGREVIVSRGELVEIGGSFRMPEVMAASGARLREVGTTNRTHLADYAQAIGSDTAMLLKVHQSNFAQVGFTAEVGVADLSLLAKEHDLPLFEDLGSGSLVDLSRHGLTPEPTVQASVAAGAGVVSFSGDKILGGPQAGIIVGRKDCLATLKRHPLARALRVGKMTLAALEATLRLYLDEARAVVEVPTLGMILASEALLERRARKLARLIRRKAPHIQAKVVRSVAKTGGGALPLQDLTSRAVVVRHPQLSAGELSARLRNHEPPIVARIGQDDLMLDVRTLRDNGNELAVVASAVAAQ